MFNATNGSSAIAPDTGSLSSLAQAWAKRYITQLTTTALVEDDPAVVAPRLLAELRNASVKAWQRTEGFLAGEMIRHGIPAEIVDPWSISKDIHDIYQRTLKLYAAGKGTQQMTAKVASVISEIRSRYTAVDPRVIGFVSMQFHHTGVLLLEVAPLSQRPILSSFFKVIDDHLYMPLHRAYNAAANYDYNDPALALVRHLLPQSTAIATAICDRVAQLNPQHRCFSGSLTQASVRVSSIRDVEMFQIYLWVCLLEQSLDALQRELFPLCLMLYPCLNVTWELVFQMVHLLGKEIQTRAAEHDTSVLTPYYLSLREMFDPKLFQGVL
ncbi:hypothetical protein NBE99_10945 [Thermosynechococcus sp. HN-54]|uniref:hypothetical protein n=1 Tax=Thermosynechococcus sp. HN-54 TaxID=2933959 RepID=UPI00202CF1FC|nr:hypothetical protein [Thermosynechococcus sp. HN-54]URR35150.1 hypothetical protein NBE99_10945 [Thermosynechococcus sp. HN-54]